MSKTMYTNVNGINTLQINIMVFIEDWVVTVKTPVPQREVIIAMELIGVKDFTVINALNSLLNKRYIRRAFMISNRACYVLLKRHE